VNKKLSQRVHAKRRAAERFGLTLTTVQLKAMERQIREGTALVVSRTSNSRSTWIVLHEAMQLRVVYHRGRGIVTILPQDEKEGAANEVRG
jgi:hypothetical protein